MNISKSLLPLNLKHCTEQEIVEYFTNAWNLENLLLKSIVNKNSFYHNPDDLRNPLIFYLGHCPAFYINKLILSDIIKKGINPKFEQMFGTGVDPQTPADLKNAIAHIEWPSVDEVWQFREQSYQLILDVIQKTSFILPINWEQPFWALMMGIEHQYVHFETSSVLIRQLPIEALKRPEDWNYASFSTTYSPNEMVLVLGAKVKFGKDINSASYGWDNEYGISKVMVDSFLLSKFMISNGEYKEFVDNGGYENPTYWDAESWQWKLTYQVKYPKFWLVDEEGNYLYRAMYDIFTLPLNWPVEVNHYEAKAFCKFKGAGSRLMTEAEWHLVNQKTKEQNITNLENNDFNLNLKIFSPHPVDSLEKSCHPYLIGNIWEWLEDDFYAFDGFKTHALYADYSLPFFDGKHKMLKGGSWATHGNSSSTDYRNWFRPNFFQHAGFRIVQDIGS